MGVEEKKYGMEEVDRRGNGRKEVCRECERIGVTGGRVKCEEGGGGIREKEEKWKEV